VITRPDIGFAVGCISRYANSPQVPHMTAAKRILRYLKGTPNLGIHFPNTGRTFLVSYANTNYGRDQDTRRPISWIVHKIGNAPIEWSSKRQPTVAMSTIEAEYRVLSDAAKDVMYLRKLFAELRIGGNEPTPILSDNQSCIKLVNNLVLHAHTKHIEIQYHFIRERTQIGEVSICYIPTVEQQADILTKPLEPTNYANMRSALGVLKLPSDLLDWFLNIKFSLYPTRSRITIKP
jgi:hypothetical protein